MEEEMLSTISKLSHMKLYFIKLSFKIITLMDMVAHTINHRTREVEADGSM